MGPSAVFTVRVLSLMASGLDRRAFGGAEFLSGRRRASLVAARSCLHSSLLADADCCGRSLQALGLPWGPEGDVHLIGAGLDVAADLVPRLFVAAGQGGVAEELGQAVELGDEVLVLPRERHVDGTADLRRVAAHLLTVA